MTVLLCVNDSLYHGLFCNNRLLKDQCYFGSKKEESDVEWYISLNSNQMILELMEAFLRELAAKWNYVWPAKLADIFVEMYEILM